MGGGRRGMERKDSSLITRTVIEAQTSKELTVQGKLFMTEM